jgi:transcriptional regulator with XRE-family HTH domain
VKTPLKKPIRRRPGPYPDLATYIRESGDTQVNMAQQLGVSQAQISRLINGENIPRAELLEKIVRYADIPRDSFTRVYLARKRSADRRAARMPAAPHAPASEVRNA